MLSYILAFMARATRLGNLGKVMAKRDGQRLLEERSTNLRGDSRAGGHADGAISAPTRSVTVNLAESPLGWLLARGW